MLYQHDTFTTYGEIAEWRSFVSLTDILLEGNPTLLAKLGITVKEYYLKDTISQPIP